MSEQETLINAGLKMKEAQILNYFFEEDKPLFSREIERALRIRQPESCGALCLFVEKGWLKYKKIKSKGKGRPQQLYSLKKSKHDILAELLGTLLKEKEELEKTIGYLLDWQTRVK